MLDRRSLMLVTALCGAAMLLASCDYRSETFRYRMTVEVETPQGLRTGSSVIEVEVSDPGPRGLPEGGINAKVRGEAVAVDLPNDKVLFALLRTPGDASGAALYPYEALKPSRHRGEFAVIERTKELKRMRGTGELPQEAFPMLVTFADLNDPHSVRQVDPHNLAANFGDGVRLARITVQMTEAPISNEIEERLEWISRMEEFRRDPDNVFTSTLPPELNGLIGR